MKVRILIVDDEVALCSSLADFLREEGFEVHESYGGSDALLLAEQEGESIAAVLADVNMPGMDGIQMWERMKPLVSPDCKVVFMSGLARKYVQEGLTVPGELLQKPFSLSLLIEKLDIVQTERRRSA